MENVKKLLTGVERNVEKISARVASLRQKQPLNKKQLHDGAELRVRLRQERNIVEQVIAST